MKTTTKFQTRWYQSIAFKVSLSISALIAVTVFLLSFMILQEERSHTESELLKIGIFISQTLAEQAALPVLFNDRPALENLLVVFHNRSPLPSAENFVSYAMIYDQFEHLLVQAGETRNVQPLADLPPVARHSKNHFIHKMHNQQLEIIVPISYRQKNAGLIRVGITERYRNELLDRVEKKTVITTMGLLLLGILTSLFMARRFIRPIITLADFAHRIGDRHWGETLSIKTSDEVGDLSRTINEMSVKLKGAFDEIHKTQNQLIQSEKFSALGKLSANLSHELKNPLTSIKMIMETATENEDELDLTPEDLTIMSYEISRMENTVNDILSFAGPQQLRLHRHDLNELIRSTYAQVRYKLEIAGVRAELDLDKRIPSFLFDAKRMEQVLMNLFLNAIQAMERGGDLFIRTVWQSEPSLARIKIADSGPGIPDAVRNQIFDPFFTTKPNGTGLGLSIVYSSIRNHGGQIDIVSEKGKGTAFWISLPVREEVQVHE